MKLHKIFLSLFLLFTGMMHAEIPLFKKPQTYKQHKMLLIQMQQAMRSGNIEKMEEVCRNAVDVMPEDAVWTYNLACALAYRVDKSESLQMLSRAIDLGFRNPEAIAADTDLKRLKGEAQFAQLIARARLLQGQPVEGVPVVVPPTVMMGIPFEINASNTVWNMDVGCFQSFFKLLQPVKSDGKASDYKGPAADLIKTWISEKSASGNSGDL
jgi:hypothetical protein